MVTLPDARSARRPWLERILTQLGWRGYRYINTKGIEYELVRYAEGGGRTYAFRRVTDVSPSGLPDDCEILESEANRQPYIRRKRVEEVAPSAIHSCSARCASPSDDAEQGESGSRALLDVRFYWRPEELYKRRILTVGFLNGSLALQRSVMAIAKEWTTGANLEIERTALSARPMIRILFGKHPQFGGGSWSYIGRTAKHRPQTEPTMQLGWIDERTPKAEVRRVVLHEFGHALGLLHEHQNPVGGLRWNRQAALRYYGNTNRWSDYEVEEQVFRSYADEVRSGLADSSGFDPQSIMLYPIPPGLANVTVGWNSEISPQDRAIVQKWYRVKT